MKEADILMHLMRSLLMQLLLVFARQVAPVSAIGLKVTRVLEMEMETSVEPALQDSSPVRLSISKK